MNQEFPAGSRWRHRLARFSVLVYGEAGGIVSYCMPHHGDEFMRAMRADQFRARYERIEHPEAPKCEHGCNPAACPGCGTNLCLGGCGRNLGPYEECSCKGRP
jgi:hypothetical protein